MPRTVQSLGVVQRLFPLIVRGEKTSTIRWRERHIVPGPLIFINDGDPLQTVEVDVFRCTEIPLSEAASFVGRAQAWPDDVMLSGMRAHYPEIQLSSIVQIVEFRPPVSIQS